MKLACYIHVSYSLWKFMEFSHRISQIISQIITEANNNGLGTHFPADAIGFKHIGIVE